MKLQQKRLTRNYLLRKTTHLSTKPTAPPIDYLSIDTEGSEFMILKDFDFARYTFRVITVEHNYTSQRRELFELLTSVGYQRVYPEISQFDG
jgi:hypothetical protein